MVAAEASVETAAPASEALSASDARRQADVESGGAGGVLGLVGLVVRRFPAALLAPLPIVPVLASLLAVAGYTASAASPEALASLAVSPLLVCAIDFAAAWLVLAGVCLGLDVTSVSRANAETHGDLCSRTDELEAKQRVLRSQAPPNLAAFDRSAAEEAATHLDAAVAELRGEGVQWVQATGYIEIWKRVHRAEEALLMLEPVATLLVAARNDRLRLQSSTIESRDELIADLDKAILKLDGLAESDASTASGGGPSVDPGIRAVLRQVRHTINEFRDDRRAGLVRARNNLAKTTMFTAATVYALLWLAIIGGMYAPTLLVATSYFVVGAIVGLFNRLYGDAGTDTVVDDFGLSWARLITTSMLSGVAAVLGVVMVHMAAATQTSAVSGTSTAPSLLASAFDLALRPNNVFIAAAFGFTPGLLIERLKRQSDEYKEDLKSSQVATGEIGVRRRRGSRPGTT